VNPPEEKVMVKDKYLGYAVVKVLATEGCTVSRETTLYIECTCICEV
jgi:hypothetical protein